MEKKITEPELTSTADTEALWSAFERTGSIDAFLRFIRKVRKPQELVLTADPS